VDAPEPRVLEVDGSTAEAAWVPVRDVLDGRVPVVPLVLESLRDHRPFRKQRVAAYGLVVRDAPEGEIVLLTRISARGHLPGAWTLPGGGVDHGESPREALEREMVEECGVECTVGALLDVHDAHFSGTAPTGRHEDFHAVHLVFETGIAADARPHVVEVDGTTDRVAWVPVADVGSGAFEVLDVVRHALQIRSGRRADAGG